MRTFFCALALAVFGGISFAQKINDDSVLLIIGTDTTTRGDFLRTYAQNLVAGRPADPSREDLEDYLDLYINFRMKVAAAKDARYDTVSAIGNELAVYRKQLAQPYLLDAGVQEQLEEETYEHMQYDVAARHILVALPVYSSPADTLAALKKIREAREKIMAGEDFHQVAFEYSDDVRTNRAGEKIRTGMEGELGYSTALSMVYPIEKTLYSLKVGEVSQPVRSRYGYHVIQLVDKKPALGKVTFSHILVVPARLDSTGEAEQAAKARIDSAYDALSKGTAFETAAKKYSDDKYSAANGGYVGSFAVNRMVPEVIAQFYSLDKGRFSKPFRSRYGWHIVFLHDKTGVPSGQQAIDQIRYAIEHDIERNQIPVKAFLDKKLQNSHWEWDEDVLSELKEYYKSLPSVKIIPKDSLSDPEFFSREILRFEDMDDCVWAFIKIADKITTDARQVGDFDTWFQEMQDEFLYSLALRHEMSLLEGKHPEFARLMEEYRDGVYLFDINNRRVWAKALYDTVGLEQYFEANRSRYNRPARAAAMVMEYDVRSVNTSKMAKFAKKAFKKNLNATQIQALADKEFGEKMVRVDSASFAAGENVFLDNMPWETGLSKDLISGTTKKAFVILQAVEPSRPYELSEIRGTVITDYQGYLEEEWIKELRARYEPILDAEVFRSMYEE